MIRDDAFNWLMMSLAVVWVVIWLFGCAGPEPRAPIWFTDRIRISP